MSPEDRAALARLIVLAANVTIGVALAVMFCTGAADSGLKVTPAGVPWSFVLTPYSH